MLLTQILLPPRIADYRSPAYDTAFRRSVETPEEFWAEVAENTVWTKKWDKVLDDSDPPMIKW